MNNLDEIKKSPDFIEKTKKDEEYIEFLKKRISENVKPEIAQNMLDFALSKEEHANAYYGIDNYCFAGKSTSKKPTIYLIIAQTGAGKSNLTMEIKRQNNNVVVIDSDAFKAFNPLKDLIIKYDPTHYGFLTGLDAYLHRDEIYSKALTSGYDVLIEVAPSTKDRLFNIDFEELRRYGYSIEAHVLSVSEINSLLSVHERFETQIASKMEAPKLTDLKRAIDSYNAVELILQDLIDKGVENISVYKRADLSQVSEDAEFIAAPILLSKGKENLFEVFRQTRKEDHDNTLTEAQDRIEEVEKQMSDRHAPSDQISQFDEVKKKIYNYLKIHP